MYCVAVTGRVTGSALVGVGSPPLCWMLRTQAGQRMLRVGGFEPIAPLAPTQCVTGTHTLEVWLHAALEDAALNNDGAA